MFCPLCQNEYTEGTVECSDCRVPLVATRQDAADSRIELYSGEDQGLVDKLLAALDAVKIPNRCEERVSPATPAAFSQSIMPVRPSLEPVVWVLRQDMERAEEVFRQVEQAGDPDVEEGGGK